MKKTVLFVSMFMVSACSTLTTSPDISYQAASNERVLHDLTRWSFEGRVAIMSKNEVEQANISWSHTPQDEMIKLSGPLGQGAVFIEFNAQGVSVDRGGGDVKTSTNPEAFIYQEVGLFVPVTFLRYWVVGLPETQQATHALAGGFEQAGWRILYKSMQSVASYILPRNMVITNDTVKLKLFIDQWNLDGN